MQWLDKMVGSRVEHRSKTVLKYREHEKEQVPKKFKDFRTQDEREIIRGFALDLTATQTAELTGITRKSVNRIYHAIRQKIFES
ncbi:MAG: hypothetical protein K6347_00925, partial [Campylobacterales bacterium]